jgi:thiamine pyrophosphate-dependent acetolactate synthase large subunit-like protein
MPTGRRSDLYITRIQDVPDQKQIVAQYCRYTGEIRSGKNVKQMVNRALQFATSDPQGPVYLCGAREPMEEDIEPYQLDQSVWHRVAPAALPQEAVDQICDHLVNAEEPLLITGYSGRNPAAVSELVKLADTVKGLRVLDTGGCDMCFPADHQASLGLRYGVEERIESADFILVVDCDVPWIPTQCKPKDSAKIVHIDIDPLKQQMPVFYIPAVARYRADSKTSFQQLHQHLTASSKYSQILSSDKFTQRWHNLESEHTARLQSISYVAKLPTDSQSPLNAAQLTSQIRASCPQDTIWVIEAVTLTGFVADHLAPTLPSSWINCGGGGLGWSGGASLGIKLASDAQHGGRGRGKFVCQIVGDGTFLFSVPGSVYWIAQRYQIPTLTIVLNNKGWNAPRRSLLLVHPEGEGSRASNEELNISFEPSPDYGGIAKAAAAGNLWAARASNVGELLELLPQAVESVKNGTGAVLEVRLDEKDAQKQNGSVDAGKTSG